MISIPGLSVQGKAFVIARQENVSALRVTMALPVKGRSVQMIATAEEFVGLNVYWRAKRTECMMCLGTRPKKLVVFAILAIEDLLVWNENVHREWILSVGMATKLDEIAQVVGFAIIPWELAIASSDSLGQDANTNQL
jgi:hypothetical protein